jgi:LemA protein
MEVIFTALILFAVVATLVGYFIYVGLIKTRNKALEALSSIDVHMKQRYDLIPNLLKIAERYMAHERTLLNEITELRTSVQKSYQVTDPNQVKEHLADMNLLGNKVSQFMVSVENYPELKSDGQMQSAMHAYQEVEGHIAAARRFYNSSVTSLNNQVQIFPSSVIAKHINIQEMPFFEASDIESKPVDVNDYLKKS